MIEKLTADVERITLEAEMYKNNVNKNEELIEKLKADVDRITLEAEMYKNSEVAFFSFSAVFRALQPLGLGSYVA